MMTTESAMCEHASALPSSDDEPWGVVRMNYVYISERLRFNSKFVSCLYERRLIARDDFHVLSSESVAHEAKVRLLLIEILPRQPPETFLTLCDIFRFVGQSHVAQRLEMNRVEVRSGTRLSHKSTAASREMDELLHIIVRLQTETRVAVKRAREERTRADNAEKRANAEKARADAANREAEVAQSLALAARRLRVAAEAKVQVAKSDAHKARMQTIAAEAYAQKAQTEIREIMWTNLSLLKAARCDELVRTIL